MSKTATAIVEQPIPVPVAPMHDIIKTIAEKGDTSALREVMEMQREMIAHEEQRIHARALAAFQANVPPIAHNKRVLNKGGSSVRYTYADLDQIMSTIRPALAAAGLSVTYDATLVDDTYTATAYVRCGGHVTQASFPCSIDPDAYMTDQQKAASATSFSMRKAVIMALGLTSCGMEDDDGVSADRPSGDKLLAHIQWVKENFPTVAQIKESIAVNDLAAASECWFELSNEDKQKAWLADTKGGIFKKAEQDIIKSTQFREAHYGPGAKA